MQPSLFTNWIIENGVSKTTLELLVAIAILATIVSIARYLIGSKTYGIYAPVILAIAYSYTGLRYGLAITAIVIITAIISHLILKKIRMHYITRIAINYCILIMALLIFFILVNKYGFGLENMHQIPSLATISIVALSDFFVKQYIQKSLKTTLLSLLGTLTVAAIGWYVITRDTISEFIINNLWIIPLLIILNIIIGQFTGLRIKDIFRFKSVVDNKDNVQK